jgi:4a-hydroxytetrahydrobiopterin dehydratase
MAPTKLVGEERTKALKEVDKWKEVSNRDAIERTFLFKDFKQAWAFMSKVAEVADKV